jgi:hypothetical protein
MLVAITTKVGLKSQIVGQQSQDLLFGVQYDARINDVISLAAVRDQFQLISIKAAFSHAFSPQQDSTLHRRLEPARDRKDARF